MENTDKNTPIPQSCKTAVMQSVLSLIKEGDLFKAVRPLHGITKHKCVRIKKGSANGADLHYDGWLVDEDGIMLNPKYSTKIS